MGASTVSQSVRHIVVVALDQEAQTEYGLADEELDEDW